MIKISPKTYLMVYTVDSIVQVLPSIPGLPLFDLTSL
jgi:hypothetical protein